MKNKTMTIPNYVIMGFTTVVSTIFHAILFLSFGGGLFLLFSRLTAHGKPTVDDYAIVVVMFVFWMFHCLALIFLQKNLQTNLAFNEVHESASKDASVDEAYEYEDEYDYDYGASSDKKDEEK